MKLIIFTGLVFFCSLTGKSQNVNSLMENEIKFSRAQASVLSAYLKKQFPDARVLIVADPNYKTSKRLQTMIKAIKENLKNAVVDSPEIPQDPESQMLPLEDILTVKSFDDLFKKHPECNLIISTLGLPKNAENMAIWKNKSKTKIALLNGNIHKLKKSIQEGLIVAAVSYQPGVKFTEKPCPENPQKAFDKRYILITPKNVDKIAKKYPNIFVQ